MKLQATNPKSQTSNKSQITPSVDKRYDLEDRTLQFASDMRLFTRKLPKDIANNEDIKQLVRSSGSVGANYIEANEALSKKDFIMRAKISRKEAKESIFWLKLLSVPNNLSTEHSRLLKEAGELLKILSAILRNSEK